MRSAPGAVAIVFFVFLSAAFCVEFRTKSPGRVGATCLLQANPEKKQASLLVGINSVWGGLVVESYEVDRYQDGPFNILTLGLQFGASFFGAYTEEDLDTPEQCWFFTEQGLLRLTPVSTYGDIVVAQRFLYLNGRPLGVSKNGGFAFVTVRLQDNKIGLYRFDSYEMKVLEVYHTTDWYLDAYPILLPGGPLLVVALTYDDGVRLYRYSQVGQDRCESNMLSSAIPGQRVNAIVHDPVTDRIYVDLGGQIARTVWADVGPLFIDNRSPLELPLPPCSGNALYGFANKKSRVGYLVGYNQNVIVRWDFAKNKQRPSIVLPDFAASYTSWFYSRPQSRLALGKNFPPEGGRDYDWRFHVDGVVVVQVPDDDFPD
eukprot:gnl/Spiro4/9199_TR4838_c0_g1_i1.p1 gnl/Spiro4/9199_TR4838_c0_g1~~gnl/Spiro4/9199_TR4838_c0_g1_i1.p1  ORF type:complete len:373 (-),score=83.76 gnl/Spiro4/9199_TR4838_c0_g1_i1:136-1254(-)